MEILKFSTKKNHKNNLRKKRQITSIFPFSCVLCFLLIPLVELKFFSNAVKPVFVDFKTFFVKIVALVELFKIELFVLDTRSESILFTACETENNKI